MTNVMHKFFSKYLFLFITLYMFRAHSAHHQERQIVSIQPLVTFFSMCLFLFITLYMFRAHSAHYQGRQIVSIQPLVTEAVLIQFVSPDDEHDMLETWGEL